jgi:paired small multidrug resistance pump
MNLNWYDYVGFLGVGFVLGSYLCLQMGKLAADSAFYQLANIIGSLFILVSLYYEPNKSSITIQITWILISVFGLVRSRRATAAGKDRV